ncbi:protein lifeguard 3 [Cyclospora cayetanensis]|uniref:Protein lifeguard 3 n=2 Tax=Cyclospora cayetanensis TaxID=88456 RepID=A0A6P5WDU9_9EIME|nr:protein lifeguard 3 [Cyclospora cayetanensis]OEH78447.1 NMDA receptor glutamate-binding chain [Cyclospora cayetanensis]
MADNIDYYSLEAGRKTDSEEALFRKEIRHGFIRKVYGIISAQLLLTTVVTSLLLFIPGGTSWAKQSSGSVIIASTVLMLISSLVLMCTTARMRYPYNYLLLLVFTCSEAMLVAVVSAFYAASSVAFALGATVVITVGLSLFACQTKHDFTSCMGVMFVLTLNLVLFGLLALFLGTWAQVLYSSLALLVFSFYLVIDTQLIIGRGQLRLEEDDYIVAAVMIYLDIINIFLTLLRLFGERSD